MCELDANGQSNFELPNVATTQAASKPLNGLFGAKGHNKCKWLIIGVIAVIIVLTIIIVAAAVGSTGNCLLFGVI